MIRIENELQYKVVMDKIEEPLPMVTDDTPINDKNMAELQLLSNRVADYDEANYPI